MENTLTPLGRLLAHRGISEAAVAGVDDIMAGGEAQPEMMWRLAPVLGWHVEDLFVIAGLDLPDELAAATGSISWNVGRLLRYAARLAPEGLERLREMIRSLPVVPVAEQAITQAEPPRPPTSFPPGPSTTVLRLLENRNIYPWNAQMLYYVADGPYVSDSTVAGVVHGRLALTPKYVTAFANLLGIPAGDLAAVTGIGPPLASGPPRHPLRAELVALGWDARRLTIDQIREARGQAFEMWKADPRSWCGMCLTYHHNGEPPPTEAPPDVTWQRVGARMVPVSPSAGPRTVVGGTAAGYAHSPLGALIAAAQLSARSDGSAGRTSWEPTLIDQFVPSDDRDMLLETLRARPDDPSGPEDFTIPAGFVFRTHTLEWVDIGLIYRSRDAAGYRGAVYRLEWQNGDWMMVAPKGGSWASAVRPVDDLSKIVPWGPP